MLVVIEGIDGCGKDSVAWAVASKLLAQQRGFPDRSTITGKLIDAYLKQQWSTMHLTKIEAVGSQLHRDAVVFQALQTTNKYEHFVELESAALDQTHLVVVRYWQSAVVYGQLDGLDPTWLVRQNRALPAAHLNVLLDVAPATALARQEGRDLEPERYEGRISVLQQARDLYRGLWIAPPTDDEGQWVSVDASQPLAAVVEEVSWWVDQI